MIWNCERAVKRPKLQKGGREREREREGEESEGEVSIQLKFSPINAANRRKDSASEDSGAPDASLCLLPKFRV